MKPYMLVLHNYLRLFLLSLSHPGITWGEIPMMSRDTKISVSREGTLRIGKRFINDGRLVIAVDTGAKCEIGDRVYMNEDVMISCKNEVVIGNRVKFGPNVKVFDNNHMFDAISGVSDEHNSEPIRIGDGTWIGANCVILKGTEIGNNCVIGAGCVVNGVIPDRSVVTTSRELVIAPIVER